MSNPPYSRGQRTENDDALSYPKLEKKISETYAESAMMANRNSLYDSYIKAFRWSSDWLNKTNGGIICFVSNGGRVAENEVCVGRIFFMFDLPRM